jgi:2-oxoglutarate ferredoxin oxidoreductase subunit gamma
MMDKILLAGFGGQGIMFLGKVMAYAGMLNHREVCWIPSYGPEMRGGTANCSVMIANEEIYSPVIEVADAGIVLNQPSYEKFVSRIKPGGVLVVNSSLISLGSQRPDIHLIDIPAGQIANQLGNDHLANMVCLGAIISKLALIDMETVQQAMQFLIGKKKPELLALNLSAICKGIEYGYGSGLHPI